MNDVTVSAPFTSQQWQRQESQPKRVILRGLRSLELLVEKFDDCDFLRISRYHHGNMGGSQRLALFEALFEFERQESL